MNPSAASFVCNTYSYTMSHSGPDCLGHLANLGFREIELMIFPGHAWPHDAGTARDLRRIIDARGLKIVAVNIPNVDINIAAAAGEMRRYSLDLLGEVVTLAGELGAAGIVLGPGRPNPLFAMPIERLTGYFFEALDELAPLAEKAGTALWMENLPFGFLPGIDSLMTTLERHGDDRIGIVYDVANAHFIDEDIGAGLERCRSRLELVHLSDTNQQLYRHDPIGRGTVPFATVPPLIDAVGYKKRPVVEIISHDADRDTLAGVDKLAAMGFGRT